MRRLSASPAFVWARAVTGAIMIALGVTIVARTVPAAGFSSALITPLVLGIALVWLGLLRLRDARDLVRSKP